MGAMPFKQGLQEVGKDCWAYLQPDGSWGWSNAGLIVDGGESLLVDTLMDLHLTATMLSTMCDAIPGAKHIDTVVNTHANADHFFGNQLMTGSRVLTTQVTNDAMVLEEHTHVPEMIEQLGKRNAAAGDLLRELFSAFDFSGIKVPPATDIFADKITLHVGSKRVEVVDVGPAHTASDLLVFVPEDKVVYTGDILFSGKHPVIWAGPVRNWRAACQMILDADVQTIVAGHGPVSGKEAVRDLHSYFGWLEAEARLRYEAGMTYDEAAFDIDLGPYEHWGDAERMIPNIIALYREFGGEPLVIDMAEQWGTMARYRTKWKARQCATAECGHPDHQH